MNIPQELLYQQYVRRELETYRAPYDPEAEFYNYVRQGNTEKIKELCHESFQEKKGLGVLSDSPLQNLKYHFTITAAMLARYCIEGGIEVTEAYDLSDYYIHKADLMKSKKEISALHPQMCLDYTTRMEKLHRNHACSRPVAQCLEYIYDHSKGCHSCHIQPEFGCRMDLISGIRDFWIHLSGEVPVCWLPGMHTNVTEILHCWKNISR